MSTIIFLHKAHIHELVYLLYRYILAMVWRWHACSDLSCRVARKVHPLPKLKCPGSKHSEAYISKPKPFILLLLHSVLCLVFCPHNLYVVQSTSKAIRATAKATKAPKLDRGSSGIPGLIVEWQFSFSSGWVAGPLLGLSRWDKERQNLRDRTDKNKIPPFLPCRGAEIRINLISRAALAGLALGSYFW